MRMSCWVVGLLVLAGPQLALAQQPAPKLIPRSDVTTLQAHARAVQLDVVVTDGKGHPVHGLKAADFLVLEDGDPQRVASFEEVRPPAEFAMDGTARPAAKLPQNTFSNETKVQPTGAMTVLLLDALETPLTAQAFEHSQLVAYLKTAKITGPVAIFSLDTKLHLIQGFTTDLERLQDAVKDRDKLIQTAIPRGGFVAQQFRYDILNGAMQDLGSYLANFPGRKNLIWFTGSIPFSRYDDDGATAASIGGALHDDETFAFDFAKMTDVLTVGRVSIYPIDAEGLRTNPAFSAAQRGLPSVNQIASFSIREADKHTDLQAVADATGGRAFYNTNGIKQAIAEVVDTGANYYTVTYYPANKNWDGKFRKLKVEVYQDGDRLEYRRGYYARADAGVTPTAAGVKLAATPNPSTGRRPLTHTADDGFGKSMQLGAIDPGSVVFQIHVNAPAELKQLAKGDPDTYLEPRYRGKAFRQYTVNFVVDGNQLQLTPSADRVLQGKVEFVAVVLDDKGGLVSSEVASVDMNVKPETYQYMLANGLQMPVSIPVPAKGNYFLRAGVHDVTSGKGGAVEVAVGEIVVGTQ